MNIYIPLKKKSNRITFNGNIIHRFAPLFTHHPLKLTNSLNGCSSMVGFTNFQMDVDNSNETRLEK